MFGRELLVLLCPFERHTKNPRILLVGHLLGLRCHLFQIPGLFGAQRLDIPLSKDLDARNIACQNKLIRPWQRCYFLESVQPNLIFSPFLSWESLDLGAVGSWERWGCWGILCVWGSLGGGCQWQLSGFVKFFVTSPGRQNSQDM